MRVAACVAALALGCAATPPRLPARDGPSPAWLSLTSAHFVVWTDLPAEEARAAIGGFEQLRTLFVDALFDGVRMPVRARARVILLRRWDRTEVTARTVPAESSPFFEPVTLLVAQGTAEPARQRHALARAMAYGLFGPRPLWLVEGIAGCMDDVEIAPAGTSVRFFPPDLTKVGPAPLAEVFADAPSIQFELTSRLIVAYLLESDRGALASHRGRLFEERFSPSEDAVRRLFGADVAAVERGFYDWLRLGRHIELQVPTPAPNAVVDERPLAVADVHVARAVLHRGLDEPPDPERMTTAATAALDEDPLHVAGHIERTIVDPRSVDLATARRLTDAHPDDWSAWGLRYRLAAGEEKATAARQACAIADGHPALATTLNIACDAATARESPSTPGG